jgi:hypothetical protein
MRYHFQTHELLLDQILALKEAEDKGEIELGM